MEYKAACDSGVTVERCVNRRQKLWYATSKTTTDEYELIKFMRSNQGTCGKPASHCRQGRAGEEGVQVLADGPCY